MLEQLKKQLEKAGNKEQAKNLQRFFKTGKGQYGEGDVFLGIKVPVQREIAKKYFNLTLKEIQELLSSKIHEHRLVGLIILNNKFKNCNLEKKEIFDFYLVNARSGNINNWDLVDLSAPNIIGEFLVEDKKILYKLALSESLWERRIAIISTFAFIRRNNFEDSLKIAKILLEDKHDLIHKAVGWMLREIGKKNEQVLVEFLNEHYKSMPRTMLRYAIERLGEEERKKYLRKELKTGRYVKING